METNPVVFIEPSHVTFLVLLLWWVRRRKRRGIRPSHYRIRPHRKLFWTEIFNHFNEKEFSRRYRMSKKCFILLLDHVKPLLLRNRKSRVRTFSHWMPPEVKLAITLRYLAGGQLLDIADNFGYKISTAYQAKESTISAILELGSSGTVGLIEFEHSNEEWLSEKAALYRGARATNPLADRCVAAVDGLAIEIQRPGKEYAPAQYANRKGFYAISCQGVCDAQRRFVAFDCNSPGSTHDSMAFGKTNLFRHLASGLVGHYWVAGDAAYPLIGSLLKPFRGRTRGCPWEDSYNFHHSSLRVTSENTFALFIQRFGIFWRCLRYDPPHAKRVLSCCAHLHNFIIDVDGACAALSLLQKSHEHRYFVFPQDELSTGPHCLAQLSHFQTAGYGTELRNYLVTHLSSLGVVRPPL